MTLNKSHENETTIASWVANAIADTGCRIVYGGHGGAVVPLVNAIEKHPDLTWVCARNEHDAATMAAAHAKMTGGLGVVVATSGPGASNLTTGLLEATMDKVALLAITGLKSTATIGYSEFQDIDQSRLFAGAGVEWSKDAASPHATIPLLRDAVATALSRRTCSHLAIPQDIQSWPSPLKLKHFCASHANLRLNPPHIDHTYIDEAAKTLVGSPDERPPRNIIAVGLRGGVYEGERMSKIILGLAEALNAPVLTRLHAKGVVDETHPLSFGVIGVHGKPGLEAAAKLISTSDRVLSIGVEDETLLLCNKAGLQIRRLIEIQPDAVAVGTRFDAEHTIIGNVKDACEALTERVETTMTKVDKKREIARVRSELDSHDAKSFGYMHFQKPKVAEGKAVPVPTKISDDDLEALLKETDEMWEAMHRGEWTRIERSNDVGRYKCNTSTKAGFCHPAVVLETLSYLRRHETTDSVSKDSTIAVDVGDVTLWSSLCLHLAGGSRTLYSERLGTMGYALNAGIAGILARPVPSGATVLVGDGGLQMSLQELATFQQMKRKGDKLLVIVFDNRVLGRVAFGFDGASGTEIVGPDYVHLAQAYGGDGVVLYDNDKAEAVLADALSREGLFLVHVRVDPTVKADMAMYKDEALAVTR